ncbi:FAD-binding domain-containing protein [Hypoxylon sp. FL1150]|nr:FAD-binding domain-containing protein [Hypoxylon sp. FL1150]
MSNPIKSQVFDALNNAIHGQILQPGSEEYEKENGSYFSALEKSSPLTSSNRVMSSSGGRTPFAGSANIQDGVTTKSVVEITVGETWAAVYGELEKNGLTMAGARTSHIGAAGFVLGGGLSMFSGRTGFSCDSVVEFEVVPASGEIVRATAEENTDLWISLKGGLNSFGIVISFKMSTFKTADIWGGVTFYMSDHMLDTIGYGFGHQAVTCVMYHTQGKENHHSLQPFTSMENQVMRMSTMRTSTHRGFADELSNSSNRMRPLMEAFHKMWQDMLSKVQDIEGLTFSFGFHPLTKATLESFAKAGGNAMAIPPSDGPLFIVLVNPGWDLPEDDRRIFASVEDFVAGMKQLASEKGLLHRYIFTNYAYQADDTIA